MATTSRRLSQTHISGIFFDMDNTIIPTRTADNATCDKIRNVLVQNYEIPLETASLITETFSRNFRMFPENDEIPLKEWRIVLWRRALGKPYENIAERLCRDWLELRYELLAPSEKVISTLLLLKSRYNLGLITNGPSQAQWEKIDRFHLRNYFDCIVVSGDHCWKKPNKAIFLMACDQLNVQPEHCIMVGDRLETDILGAHKSGFAAGVWVPNKETTEDVDVEPDAMISDVTQLPHLLMGKLKLNRYLDLSEPESENSNCSEAS